MFIIGGDFKPKNTQRGSRLTLTKCKELLLTCSQYKFQIMSTEEPTYWPTYP